MAHPKPASPNEPRSSTDPPPTDGGKMRDEGSSSSTTSTAGAPGATGSAVASPSSPAAVNAATSPSPENATESFATRTEDTTGEEQQPKREDEEVPPSYETTRSSPIYYSQPKSLLNEGRFEEALQLIESTMIELRSRIARGGGSEEEGQGEEAGAADADNECHEALAPLYYLYGTTLLYSVEESDDMMNHQQQQAATGGGGEGAGMPSEEMAEDIQIAWENLDLARSIMVDRVVGEDDIKALIVAAENCDGKSNSNDVDPQDQEQQDELKAKVLDLAQIHLRLADLQKANGAYSDALSDYKRALYLRRVALGTEFDRRVADVCYSLGITSMMLAAEGDRAADGDADAAAGGAADGAGAATSTGLLPPGAEDGILGMMGAAAQEAVAASKPTPEQCRRLRERSVMHYLDCGRAFGGCIALLCGVDRPEDVVGEGKTIVAVEEEEEGDEDEDGDKKPSAAAEAASSATKTVDDKRHEHQAYVTASKTLADIRSKCSDLANSKPSAASASSSDAAQSGDDNNKNNNNEAAITDLLELLDELQETIDSQEQDMGGIQEVHEMKTELLDELQETIDSQEQDMGGIEAAITDLLELLDELQETIDSQEQDMGGIEAAITDLLELLDELQETIDSQEQDMGGIEAAITDLLELLDELQETIDSQEQDMGGIEAAIPSAEPDAKRAKTE
eukprot:CAMPEP_0178532616 /NCGR_PEP_ID=MMETSP0696-20121128/34060_1 /TAXON_ID=265572 /ORGANISM="Extubocellulus spinifer, Strain CCMP396" /LENGTH=681 /DNA_ID=CAMNT_0020164607 /DNA_START=95 /DNA_END=2140 /DNA_ORIENTATION=+